MQKNRGKEERRIRGKKEGREGGKKDRRKERKVEEIEIKRMLYKSMVEKVNRRRVPLFTAMLLQIGRASCRERVSSPV